MNVHRSFKSMNDADSTYRKYPKNAAKYTNICSDLCCAGKIWNV